MYKNYTKKPVTSYANLKYHMPRVTDLQFTTFQFIIFDTTIDFPVH